MGEGTPEGLPAELELAVLFTPVGHRRALSSYLALDLRLGQIVAKTREPMLGQMRLAWWRENLAKPASERPKGDEVLDAIGVHWPGKEQDLAAAVDAWETMLTSKKLTSSEIKRFASGRTKPLGRFLPGQDCGAQDRLATAASLWAIADAASRVSDAQERSALVKAGLSGNRGGGQLPRVCRAYCLVFSLDWRSPA